MLYHISPNKDTEVGLRAVHMAKEKIPELTVFLFGAYKKPSKLPEWIKFYQNPSEDIHVDINNRCAIYVGCSRSEGWGLTVGEAMMCGQAVACTDNDGYKEMGVDGRDLLITPVGNAEALSNSIIKLIYNDELRWQIARNGTQSIRKFNIEESYKKFKQAILTNP